MPASSRSIGAGLCAAGLLAFGSLADAPAFGPDEGASVTKNFEISGAFELDDFSLVVDGQDLAEMVSSISMSMETLTVVSVADEYASVGAGRPMKLVRTYDTIAGETSVSIATDWGGEDQDVTLASALEGSTVVFTWDEDAGEYGVAFADEEGDEDLLDGLAEEMDLRYLLPAGEVSEGDTWEVEVGALAALAEPGGHLSLLPDELPDELPFEDFEVLEEMFSDDVFGSLEDLLEGSCECTYAGSRDEDGIRVGEIVVVVEISSAIDLADVVEEFIGAMAEQIGEELPIEIEVADLSIDLAGEGVLLWDLEAGRLHSFESRSELQVAVDLVIVVDAEGETHHGEFSIEMSGSIDHLVTVEG